jgi:integrase
MATGRISKRTVDAFEAGDKDRYLWDESLRGFGLRITPRNSRSYVLQYRMGGREAPTRRYTIGKHGSPWTAETARKEAERLLLLVGQGTDPVEADKERRRQAVDLAFDRYAELFIELYLKKRWKQWRLGAGVLRREVVPVLRTKPLPRIKRSDVAPIWDRLLQRPAVARLTHATLRKLFRWAISRGDLDRSPLEGDDAPPAVPSRDRVLSDEELASVWRNCEKLGEPFASLFRMLILTAQRRNEVASLDWSELDRTNRSWTIPGKRTKNGKPQFVPLSDQAIVSLDTFAGSSKWKRRGLVFTTTGLTPVSGFSKAKRRLDELMQEELDDHFVDWRAHDIRRTVATGLQRLGTRFEVTEAVLNHVSGSKSGVAGVYQRYDWAAEKRAALDAWSDHVARLSEREEGQ